MSEIELPEFLHCVIHGEYAPRAYYNDKEIIEMLETDGRVECPICIFEIVGIEGV